jgi:hypothetical protein
MRIRGAALLACGLALAAAGCGGSRTAQDTTGQAATPQSRQADQPASSATATPQTGIAPRYSPAKRRYLAHFKASCSRADREAALSSQHLSLLISQLGHGDRTAVGRVTEYLARTADGFARGLRRTLQLGVPPPPDTAYGERYLADAVAMISAIRSLAGSVARLDAPGIQSATRALGVASADARSSGGRYGFVTCGAVSSAATPTGPIA